MEATYGTYVDDTCFDIHDYADDTDDDTNSDTADDTDDGGRGNLYSISYSEPLILERVQPWMSILAELWTW